MAYQNTFYVYEVPVTCTGNGDHSWITADFRIEATPNSDNSSYDVKVYARIDSEGRMNWTGDGTLRVTCNGKSAFKEVKLAMYSSGTTSWDGPATFSFGEPGISSLVMSFDLDLTDTIGTNGRPGPTHNSDEGNLQHFYYNNYSIPIGDGGLVPLITPPIISNIENSNKYNGNSGISASTNSIGIKWVESGTSISNRYYRINGGNWVSVSSVNITIPNLYDGTNYTIEVKSSNSSGDSNILSIIVRTRHSIPSVSLTLVSRTIDSMTFNWSSDTPLVSTKYKVGSGDTWTNTAVGTSGNIVLTRLSPNTSYTLYFKGTSTVDYDSLDVSYSTNNTTLDIARIISVDECIFGQSFTFSINKKILNSVKIKIWTTGNSRQPEFEMIANDGNNTFTADQTQLDSIYRCFTNSNSIPIYFSLVTVGQWQEWADATVNKTLRLTGIARTARIGVNNDPRRAQCWVGVNGTPRRAIMWVGVDNKPRRSM